mgnify:CR=1 FL=1
MNKPRSDKAERTDHADGHSPRTGLVAVLTLREGDRGYRPDGGWRRGLGTERGGRAVFHGSHRYGHALHLQGSHWFD